MASEPAVFHGTFSDFKTVKTRSVAQFIFELPIEAADAALTILGGVPKPGSEVAVAIARLSAAKAHQKTDGKERKSWRDLPYPQQAAMRCNEPAFFNFLSAEYLFSCGNKDEAASAVRQLCGVESRSDLRPGTSAGHKWQRLDDQYQAWLAVA